MNVLVIDDHPLILHAMRSVVQQLAERVEVVTVTGSQAARDALSAGAEFDLALLDLQLGYDDGFALLEELRTTYPAMPIVVVAASDFRDDVMRAIDLGAMGFVPKCSSNEVLVLSARDGALRRHLPAALRDAIGPQHRPRANAAHCRIGTIASTAIAPPRPSRRST
jgi:DNA-binding NarL/FixJ family response regulator